MNDEKLTNTSELITAIASPLWHTRNSMSSVPHRYAIAFGLAVIKPDWVNEAWENRDTTFLFTPTNAEFTRPFKLKAFEGHKICFLGFAAEEHDHMIEILNKNGGVHATIDDPECTHVVSEFGFTFLSNGLYHRGFFFVDYRLNKVKCCFSNQIVLFSFSWNWNNFVLESQ